MLFPMLRPSSFLFMLPQPVERHKDMQTEQLLCWSGVIDTEHSTTSDSNEVETNS